MKNQLLSMPLGRILCLSWLAWTLAVQPAAGNDQFKVPMENLRLWLRADAGVVKFSRPSAATSKVTRWEDQSGKGKHVVLEDAFFAPTWVPDAANGMPALRFDGKSDFMEGNLGPISSPLTLIVVARFASLHQEPEDYDYVIMLGSKEHYFTPVPKASIARFSKEHGNGDRYYSLTYEHLFGPVLKGQVFQVITAEHGTSRPFHNVYLNGELERALDYTDKADRDPLPIKGSGDFVLGKYIDRIQHLLNGDLAEILVYDTILSASTRKNIEQQLMKKYLGR